MAKTPRNVKTEFDPTTPISPEYDGSCFGVEYAPRTPDCQSCHDSTLCSIKYQEHIREHVDAVEQEYPMLDKEIVPVVDEEFGQKLANLAEKYFNEGNAMTREEIGDALTMEYSITDPDTRDWWINRWISNYSVSHLIKE